MGESAYIGDRSPAAPFKKGAIVTHYQAIGQELLAYERGHYRYRKGEEAAVQEFREGVSYISTEVLQRYLDDLLDLDVSEETLHVQRKGADLWLFSSALVGVLVSGFVGIHTAVSGASFIAALALSMGLALPFAMLWYFVPRFHAGRRMMFAQLVAQEVGRRRGQSKDQPPTNFVLVDFMNKRVVRSLQNPALGVQTDAVAAGWC